MDIKQIESCTFSVFPFAGWASVGTVWIALLFHLLPPVRRLESRLTGITSSYANASAQVVQLGKVAVFAAAGASAAAGDWAGRRRGLDDGGWNAGSSAG